MFPRLPAPVSSIPGAVPVRGCPSRAALALSALLLAAWAAALVSAPPLLAQSEAALIDGWQQSEWPDTDFEQRSVALTEILSGGPPKDGIPPIDAPKFVSLSEAAEWVEGEEPVVVVQHEGDARAYPLQILIWHEIVNDQVGGRPVAVTYCPLCNSALVFDRRVGGQVLDFGTSGKLRLSNLVMWDRQTCSWWQQITGEAIVGTHTGKRLTPLPAPMVAFATFREAYPEGTVLSRETGAQRDYGVSPYERYDRGSGRPYFFRGAVVDPRLPPMERVVALEQGGEARAYAYTALAERGVVTDVLGDVSLVVFHRPGARSAVDRRRIADSRDVGQVGVFRNVLDGRALTFERSGEGFRDTETGSNWNLLGQAVEGPLRGRRLAPLPHDNPFAFAWFAARPDSTLWQAP